jgi:hypothetical protein
MEVVKKMEVDRGWTVGNTARCRTPQSAAPLECQERSAITFFRFNLSENYPTKNFPEVLLDTYIYHLIRVQMILDTQAGFHDGRTR